MQPPTYYLSSLESIRFETVRECQVERVLAFDTGKLALEVLLRPGVVGQDFNRSSDINKALLVCRHEDASLDPIREFPCFVFVTIPVREGYELQTPIRSDDLEIVGWGELYRSPDDAKNHRFG